MREPTEREVLEVMDALLGFYSKELKRSDDPADKLTLRQVRREAKKACRAFLAVSTNAPIPTDADPQGTKRVFLGPTPEMIEAGAQRLVRWETGKEKWPDAWSKLDVRAARNDAERVWLSMWLAAPVFVSERPAIPEGWKLVPIKPTIPMLDAGMDAKKANNSWSDTYRAMLDAAPSEGGQR